MSTSIGRRNFLQQTAAGTAVVGTSLATSTLNAASASGTVTVGVMGMSRGLALARNFATQPDVKVKYVCDIDTNRAGAAAESVGKVAEKPPEAIGDYRRILDDKDVDVLICAAPNHWHAPATILACSAGKHVYVEKPCSHNAREGELMVQAARKNNRAVQMGSQRRSGAVLKEAVQHLTDGAIGRVYYARCWYANTRGSIGTGKSAPVPKHIDYDLWQGPAPRVPYMDNRVHYNWHWFWHWGNGELGNNGIHAIDVARWGLGVDYPTRVTSSGGRYRFDDDQETPDTHVVSFEFPDKKQIAWEGLSCNRHGIHKTGFGITFHGESGSLHIGNADYTLYDEKNKVVTEGKGDRGDTAHVTNLLDAIRNDTPLALNAEIEKGHKSTLLCHLGNISQRTGRALNCDPSNGHIVDDSEAMGLWGREYEPGWEPKV